MEFWGSGSTMKTIDPYKAEQLVLKALDKDPAKQLGLQTIHHRGAFESGVHLSWSITFQFLGSYTLSLSLLEIL